MSLDYRENQPPVEHGVASPTRLDKDQPQLKQLRIERARSLKELAEDYSFFTPGLLYSFVPAAVVNDPLQVFVQEHGEGLLPTTITLSKPFVIGLARPNGKDGARWEHTLYGIDKRLFMPFMAWTKSLQFYDPKARLLVRVRPMMITTLDPLFLDKNVVANNVPSCEIGVLALDTSMGNVWIDDTNWQSGVLPRVVKNKHVYRDTEVFAKAIAANSHTPHDQVEEDQLDPALGLTPSEAWLLQRYGDREPVSKPKQVDISYLPVNEQREIKEFIQQVQKGGL
jgi:hypothetical protein